MIYGYCVHCIISNYNPCIFIQGCRSVKTGFVSHDDDAPISYISSKYPNPTQPEIYRLVRNACLRSLSGEVRDSIVTRV